MINTKFNGPTNTVLLFTIAFFMLSIWATAQEPLWPEKTYYRYKDVKDQRVFYREAGDPNKPTILLLHGYPSSSHTYRELIPLLSGRYHIIAPDNLGSGFSSRPDPDVTTYTFDLLAEYLGSLIEELELEDYVIYMQDFGAPVGYRVILDKPEKLKALIIQNANAYLEGMTLEKQAFFKSANEDHSNDKVSELNRYTGKDAIINYQYLRDVPGERKYTMSPDTWTHDLAFLQTEKNRDIQVQLFQDYYSNLMSYPKWQAYLQKYKPPTLIVWGKNDPAFRVPGARAYLRDVPDAELNLIDAGHFAVEEKPVIIAKKIINFMNNLNE